MKTQTGVTIETDAPISTWFGVGGGADRLARPVTVEELIECVRIDPDLRVLGDGANLLVDDAGVGELVVDLSGGVFRDVAFEEESGRVFVGGGARLPKLINECVRRGLGGLERLAGIPASVGGAVIMNAGGAFGQVCDHVARVHAIDRAGREHAFDRSQIDFGYRRSRLNHLIVYGVEFRLERGDPAALREEQKRCMAYKKETQPLADDSAGCVFKNPTLASAIEGVGGAGERVSAGMLIDRAGLKGERVGGARVSDRHANFIVTDEGARARDVIELISVIAERVEARFGVRLEREVV
ncbi:MAG: UDP-N-acetylmuramate dehydrogenase, partial [Phycisphaerales bacterium JB059]